MKNPDITLTLDDDIEFYSPDGQGLYIGVSEKMAEVMEETIKEAIQDAIDNYNEILTDNLKELFGDENTTRTENLSLQNASFLRLTLADDLYTNSLKMNLAPAVNDCVQDMQTSMGADEVDDFRKIVEFWEASAKKLRETFDAETKNDGDLLTQTFVDTLARDAEDLEQRIKKLSSLLDTDN